MSWKCNYMLLTNKRSDKPCISIGIDGHSIGEVQYTGFWQSVASSNQFKFKFKSVSCYTIQFKLQVTCDVIRYRLQGWDTQTLQWRHNGHDGVSNHQPHRSKENIKVPRHWPLWGEFTGDRWISLHEGPITRKMFPFDDVIMITA